MFSVHVIKELWKYSLRGSPSKICGTGKHQHDNVMSYTTFSLVSTEASWLLTTKFCPIKSLPFREYLKIIS